MSRAAQKVANAWAAYNEGRPPQAGKKWERWRVGNVAFDGPIFTSYYTDVAKYHRRPGGPQFVLLSENKYSVTTARHLSAAAWALQQEYVFYVPYVAPVMQEQWVANAIHLIEQIKLAEMRARRGWKHTWEDWEKEIVYAYRRASDYIHITGVPVHLERLELIINAVSEYRQDKLFDWNHPNRVKARERAFARRLALKALNLTQ